MLFLTSSAFSALVLYIIQLITPIAPTSLLSFLLLTPSLDNMHAKFATIITALVASVAAQSSLDPNSLPTGVTAAGASALSSIQTDTALLSSAAEALSTANPSSVAAELPSLLSQIYQNIPTQFASYTNLIPTASLSSIIANLNSNEIGALETAVSAFGAGQTAAAIAALESFAVQASLVPGASASSSSSGAAMQKANTKAMVGLASFFTVVVAAAGNAVVF